ncbi:gluconeogenesis factor YvcK family protein [uncultured Anaerofustis sp.]|uniref:gluconeogenesis factor YvcK family protein n=1 Tax=uncultured Anaerofustis sp. TaxID=904996 RepID=UPI0025CC1BF7|nr:gluconeogenesis factor YvcK family protein [uncultured Anaerofustis sp.]
MKFKDKNIVIIGGGTGNSVLLKEFKKHTDNITAIVTVSDDGGSTGKLRKDLGILAVGDIRNCITALAEDESTMTELMEYRFTKGALKKHSFGNLFLAALNEISESFPKAIKDISDVLAIKGEVVAVSKNDDITLCALLDNTAVVNGESKIPKQAVKMHSKIKKVFMTPTDAKVNDYAVEKIENADIIILSPGSLYTSIIPNLLIKDIPYAIDKNKKAKKYFIANIMTQHGETDGFDVWKHVTEIEKHIPRGCKIFDEVIYSTTVLDKEVIKRYKKKHADVVEANITDEMREIYTFTGLDLAREINGVMRHNSEVLVDYLKTT